MKVIHNEENMQITILDERYYTEDEITFYPSVTTVLDLYPKGRQFEEWLKQVGFNASQIVKQAGETGSKIHDAIDRFLNGETILWHREDGEENFNLEEWKMVLKFFDFWEEFKPEL